MKFSILLSLIILFSYCHCESLISYPNGKITFTYLNETYLNITATGKPNTWVGIGYGSSMFDTDMNIIEFATTNAKVLDAYSFGERRPEMDNQLNSPDILTDQQSSLVRGMRNTISISYLRPWKTNDHYHANLSPGAQQDMIYAWGNGQLSFHGGNFGFTTIILPKS